MEEKVGWNEYKKKTITTERREWKRRKEGWRKHVMSSREGKMQGC